MIDPLESPLHQFETSQALLHHFRARVHQQSRRGSLSLAQLAIRGGFKSRAYVSTVFSGQRKLTEESLPGFSRMLDLSASEESWLRTLVRAERAIPGSHHQLVSHRARLRNRENRSRVEVTSSVSPVTFHVYAAVPGNPLRHSLAEISRTAQLSLAEVEIELRRMVDRGWIFCESGQYFCGDAHLIVDELRNPEFTRAWFLRESKTAQDVAEENFSDTNKLFVTFKFGVQTSELPALSRALRQFLSGWVEKSIAPEANQVATLTVSLT